MGDKFGARDIINLVLSDEKLKNSKSFGTVYHDEPILTTAGQLSGYIPPEIAAMKKIANNYYSFRQSDDYIFYQQCKAMENYEDDFQYDGEFVRYFPTYQAMSLKQLRGYFTWRTKIRKGIVEQTSLSFVYVYLYELLMQIGVKSAEDGLTQLKDFRDAYKQYDYSFGRYIEQWINDYVVYYNLDKALLEESDDITFDNSLLVLINYKSHANEDVFSAIKMLSSYNMDNSKFYKQYPDDVMEVVCNVFDKLSEYYSLHRKNSFCDKLFGRKISCSYNMFGSAVFYDTVRYNNYEYVINDIHKYRCTNGNWTCEKYFGSRGKSSELGSVLKAVDCIMRQKYDYKHPIKQDIDTKLTLKIVDKEVEKFLEFKEKNKATVINIDVSKLDNIRAAAKITRDKLIVDEDDLHVKNSSVPDINDDMEITFDTLPYISTETVESADMNVKNDTPIAEEACVKNDIPVKAESNDTMLDDVQYKFMQCLLYDEDYNALLSENHVLLSVLVDDINEQMYDNFGDTVIIFDGDTPVLIDDYTDELRGLILR